MKEMGGQKGWIVDEANKGPLLGKRNETEVVQNIAKMMCHLK